MASFCRQCALEDFGEDAGDLAYLGGLAPTHLPDYGYKAICEGCGYILVNDQGTCLTTKRDGCLRGHGDKRIPSPPVYVEYHCHAIDCNKLVSKNQFVCYKHWVRIPRMVQKLLLDYIKEGRDTNGIPSVSFTAVAFVALSCIAQLEGKPLPTLDS